MDPARWLSLLSEVDGPRTLVVTGSTVPWWELQAVSAQPTFCVHRGAQYRALCTQNSVSLQIHRVLPRKKEKLLLDHVRAILSVVNLFLLSCEALRIAGNILLLATFSFCLEVCTPGFPWQLLQLVLHWGRRRAQHGMPRVQSPPELAGRRSTVRSLLQLPTHLPTQRPNHEREQPANDAAERSRLRHECE